MYKITKQQHANLVYARDVMWPAVPPENVIPELGQWRCGTLACFGGHVATDPHFKSLGVISDCTGAPMRRDESGYRKCDISIKFFGDLNIFATAYAHAADVLCSAQHTDDHALVANRLNYVLANCEIID